MTMALSDDQPATNRNGKAVLRRVSLGVARLAVALAYPWPRGKRLKNGLKVMIDPKRRWIDFNLAIKSHYEQGTLDLVEKLLPEKGVFMDVGANIGVISTFAARCAGAEGFVYAFEPDNINFARLTWARQANDLPQMLPLPLALGDAPKLTPLRRAASGDGGLTSLAEIDGFEVHGSVPVMRLDDFAASVEMERVDVVKIDVEGYEKRVIAGALQCVRRHRPTVIMEMVTEDAVGAGQLLVENGYLSFIAGDKADLKINTLRASPPHRLEHNNMLFVHESRIPELPALGFETV